MSFREKSIIAMLAIQILVYGWYFTGILLESINTPVNEINYQNHFIIVVGIWIVLLIISHIYLAIKNPKDAHEIYDERSETIDTQSWAIGGYVVSSGAFFAMIMAMLDWNSFWIANMLLATLVMSEIVTSVISLIKFRRGF